MDKTRRKLKPIARKRRNLIFFLLAILFAISTSYIFFLFAPDQKIKLSFIQIPILPVFLISLFSFIYSILRFVFIQKYQAVLISLLLFAYLLLRLTGLTHWIFAALFLALFITIELFIIKKK